MEKEVFEINVKEMFKSTIKFVVNNKLLSTLLLVSIVALVLSLILPPMVSFYIIAVFTLFLLVFISLKFSMLFISLILVYLGYLIPNLLLLLAPSFYLENNNKGNNGLIFVLSTMFFVCGLLFLVIGIIKKIKKNKGEMKRILLSKNLIFVVVGILFIALFNNAYVFQIEGISDLLPYVLKGKYYWIEIAAIILYFSVYLLLNLRTNNKRITEELNGTII